MSITISNLEVIISSSSVAGQQYIQLRADVDNNSGEDILIGQNTFINVGFDGSGGPSEQIIDRFSIQNGQSEQILSQRHLISTNNTLEQFQFVFPVSTGNQVTVLAADAFIYNPFETRLELDMHVLVLDPTRSGFPINPDNWFATLETNFRNFFLEEYQLRLIEFEYDDGSTVFYTLPEDIYLLSAPTNITDSSSAYIEVSSYQGSSGSNLPIYVRKDKTVTSIRYTLTPSGRWEPYQLSVSPANIQNNYTPMQLELTTSGNSIFLNVTQGVAPYTYLWNDGATSQNRENVAPGLYSVTVTDALGYTAQASVQLGDLHYFSDNPVVLTVNVSDHTSKDFLRVVCEVWVERDYLSDSYEKIFEAEQPVDSQGNTLFDMRDVLDSFLSAQLPGPSIQRQDQQFCRFYLRYFERSGDPPTNGQFTQVQESTLLLGGISELEYARGNFFGLHFANKPFYTWQPAEKYVAPDQPEYLLFVVNSFDYTQFDVVVTLYYLAADGSESSSEHVIFTRDNVTKYEPYLFPVGPDQLNLLDYQCAESGLTLDRYEVFCRSGATIVSEVRTYILDYSKNIYRRYFLYQNSLGGWDTLVTTGKKEEELSIDTESQERYLPPNHSPLEQPSRVVQRTAEPEVSISTGYQSKAMMQALQDFLLAREIYTIRPQNNRLELTPVEVDLRNATILDEEENLQSFRFSYRPPKYRRYTPMLLAPAVAEDPIIASATVTDNNITLEASGGTSPYTVLWSDGSTLGARANMPDGTYDVLIRDSASPPQAVRICGITVDFSETPVTLPPVNVVPQPSLFVEDINIYDSNAPGYQFQHPSGSTVLGPIMLMQNSYTLQAGINRLEASILLQTGANLFRIGSLDVMYTSGDQLQPTTVTQIQDIDDTVRGSWQRAIIEIDSPVEQLTNVLLGIRCEITNPGDPTFFMSDLVLNP